MVDGIFYDWASTPIGEHLKWTAPGAMIDVDADGVVDDAATIDELWGDGFLRMATATRELSGATGLVMGNAGWNTGTKFKQALNGVMFECFGESDEVDDWGGNSWAARICTHRQYMQTLPEPRLTFLQGCSTQADFQEMRYGLCSALMFDGYFAFTDKDEYASYHSTLWYDKYAVDITTG